MIFYTGCANKSFQFLNLNVFRSTKSSKTIKHFLKPYEYSYDLSVLPLKLYKSGGIKEGDNFSDFFPLFFVQS